MKLVILIFSLVIYFCSYSQIWKEPFDTLLYYDQLERLPKDQIDIQSYTVKKFISKDSITQFNYYGFNEAGLLSEEHYGISPDDKLEVTKYYYDEKQVFQEIVTHGRPRKFDKREFIYNDRHRLISISTKSGDSVAVVRYVYTTDNLLDSIIYSPSNRTTFTYNDKRQIVNKKIFQDNRLKEYFNYEHPNKNTLIYENCLLNEKGIVYEPCERVEGYYNECHKLVKIISHYDSSNIFVIDFKYNAKGKMTKMSDHGSNGSGSKVVYTRNKRGKLTKMEHYDLDGKCYMYFIFDYKYR